MGYVKKEDIAGINIEQEMVCYDCITGEEWKNLTAEMIIERDTVDNDDGYYLCDRCGKPL